MRYVIAGFASGYLMGVVFIGLVGLILVVLRPQRSAWWQRTFPAGTSLIGLGLPLSGLLFLTWGLIGLLHGLLYRGFLGAFPGPGLGSPNLAYTLFILVIALAFSWLLIPLRRAWGPALGLLLAFAALFGWLLPWLAF